MTMFNFGNKRVDELSKEVDRLNTIVTVMMKEISALKTNKSEQSEQDMIAHYEAMNAVYHAGLQKPNHSNAMITASLSSGFKASLQKSKDARTSTARNGNFYTDDVIIAAMDDATPSKCSTHSGSSHHDYGSSHSHSSHSHSSHSSSYDSSSSDCGSCD